MAHSKKQFLLVLLISKKFILIENCVHKSEFSKLYNTRLSRLDKTMFLSGKNLMENFFIYDLVEQTISKIVIL